MKIVVPGADFVMLDVDKMFWRPGRVFHYHPGYSYLVSISCMYDLAGCSVFPDKARGRQ